MTIYELVFGVSMGPVNCAFHDDSVASAGVGPNGEYNCFACGAKAHDDIGFVMRYFKLPYVKALRITNVLKNIDNFKYREDNVTDEQRAYLNGCGIIDTVIDKFFFNSAVGKLMFRHLFNSCSIGFTWFNNPVLTNYNAGSPKYKYDKNIIAGFVYPYDLTYRNKILITEGEKDMLTATSKGLQAVAKIGGANTRLIAGKNFEGKEVIICYDCDDAGRQGALADADLLVSDYGCKVKVIDLKLQDKEDLNDYFIKYHKTVKDFAELVKNTPLHVAQVKNTKTKLEQMLDNLTVDEKTTLKSLLNKEENNE